MSNAVACSCSTSPAFISGCYATLHLMLRSTATGLLRYATVLQGIGWDIGVNRLQLSVCWPRPLTRWRAFSLLGCSNLPELPMVFPNLGRTAGQPKKIRNINVHMWVNHCVTDSWSVRNPMVTGLSAPSRRPRSPWVCPPLIGECSVSVSGLGTRPVRSLNRA